MFYILLHEFALKLLIKSNFIKQDSSENVTITIDPNTLAFYDENLADWNLEKGNYYLYLGTASNQIVKKIKFNIE